MKFQNREEAAALLAERLAPYRGQRALILALPRGAVPMGEIIAQELQGELGLMMTRKLAMPGFEEYAIGSVGESGQIYRNPEAAGIPDSVFEASKKVQMTLMAQRRKDYGLKAQDQALKGRITILLDDGIATGSTMLAAVREARAQQPAQLIVAAAVAPPNAARLLEKEVDALVLLDEPQPFYAVGEFFRDFREVTDQEVKAILAKQIKLAEPSASRKAEER